MTRRVTAADVGRDAGVSRTTVSFVLNNVEGMRISAETAQRVVDSARRLNYHPHASARRLVTGKTGIIAYITRQESEEAFADTFLLQVLNGVQTAAKKHGYEVLFAPIPFDDETERCTRLLQGRHVDGLIISGPRHNDAEICKLIENNSQVVVQGHWTDMDVASVDIDNVKAAEMATEHLIQHGHERLGMVVHAPRGYTSADSRVEGFLRALRKHDLKARDGYIQHANFTMESGATALEAIMRRNPRPTAVFISSDTVAFGALHAARKLGLETPGDLAIAGFDDVPLACYSFPTLTTVRLPAFGTGWAAANLLIRMVSSEEEVEKMIVLESELIIRESCGAEPR